MTVTSTATATATITAALNNFKIYISGNENDGKYITDKKLNAPSDSANLGAADTSDIAEGDTFSLDDAGNLILVSGQTVPAGFIAVQGQVPGTEDVTLTTPGTPNTFKVTCVPTLSTTGICPLTCTGGQTGSSASWNDGTFWWEISDDRYNYFTPYVVSV